MAAVVGSALGAKIVELARLAALLDLSQTGGGESTDGTTARQEGHRPEPRPPVDYPTVEGGIA